MLTRSPNFEKNLTPMRYLITLSSFAVLIALSGFYLQSCNEVQAAEMGTLNQNHLIFAMEAEAFVASLEQGKGEDFSGLVISYEDGGLRFQKTRSSGMHLAKVSTSEQPLATRVEIGADGEIYPLDPEDYRSFEFYKANFDFAYFSWEDVRRLALASETIYLSGATVTYGVSIHDPGNPERAAQPAFNFKIEGDFAKARATVKNGDTPDPLTLNGTPCPPFWDIIYD